VRVAEKQFKKTGLWMHTAQWGEVVVGALQGGAAGGADRVIDTSHGSGIPHGHTLWFRAEPVKGGEPVAIAPRPREQPVIVLDEHPDNTKVGVYTPPTDTQAVLNIIEGLGATWMATHETASGEVTCPHYDAGIEAGDNPEYAWVSLGLRKHLEFAHAVLPADHERFIGADLHAFHENLHNTLKGEGFPHRHVPEDNTLFGAPQWPWETA
jgi:hypothetical protein